ncbi:MAG: HAMP domain-containing protein [Alcaligenaceae bacterium]|jgi:two-component system osmolarity sensor histidine kinase EnvZ|nr:HAMP domain-containing protein [Alcaligenaceae bacterium]
MQRSDKKRSHLRKFWPFSLRLQTFLLILLTILSVQAMNFYIAQELRDRYIQNVVVNHLSSTIRLLRASLANTPTEQRKSFVNQASRGQWDLIESRRLPKGSYYSWSRGKRRHESGSLENRYQEFSQQPFGMGKMIRRLNKEFNDGTRIALSRGSSPALYISLVPTEQPEIQSKSRDWLVVPLSRIEAPDTGHLFFLWLTVSLALLLLSLFFSWYITRPLSRLSQAAEQVAKGQTVYVQPSGPRETKHLGLQFNSMLQALNESKEVQRTLLAGLPHDLKSPLARLWLRLEMTEDESIKSGMRKDLQEMQAIINQFINYLRGSDPSSYQLKRLDVTQWLNERVNSWQEAGKDVQLLQVPDSESCTIMADQIALDRLLDNLIGNALKHGEEPVEIRATELHDSNELYLSVADHGKGIAAEQRDDALRAFSRLDQARTKTGSVGLGLALVEEIVNSHQGRLQLTDHPSGGLQVDIYFPLS